jgi:hypothetical protein
MIDISWPFGGIIDLAFLKMSIPWICIELVKYIYRYHLVVKIFKCLPHKQNVVRGSGA